GTSHFQIATARRAGPNLGSGSHIGHRNLEVVHASDLLDDVVRGVVPDVDAEGEVGLGFIGAKSDWPAPRAKYTPCCCVASPSPTSVNPASRAQPKSRPLGPVGCTRSNTTAFHPRNI